MPGNVRYGGLSGSQKPPHPTPTRTMSLDSLHDRNATFDPKIQDYIPSRITRTTPKINDAAMQFVKTGPAVLYKSATEQIKKAEAVKAMRQHLINEEAEWQANLDKWKSSRRKRNEEVLERVIEIKKNEQEEELVRTRRKSKTFSEMQEDKNKRGRRYNLVVHDDDQNDLTGLGLSSAKSTSSLNDAHEENDVKDLDQDNKDAKSDAGFCTGSDTGSDGVFAEDNISDTSSALGDKKEAHDSLLDHGVSKEEEPHINGHGSSLITEGFHSTTIHTDEYTYDKAIAGYRQYAENSAKKRTSSITSLNSNTSCSKDDERKDDKSRINGCSPSPNKSNKMEEKLNFFTKEMERDFRTSPEPKVTMREKSSKVDIGKRRSMFEIHDSSPIQSERDQKLTNRRSLDMSSTLRNKVASFENLETETPKVRGVTPTRDTNLRSKVASFENLDMESNKVRGVTPTRDAKFQEKRAAFVNKDTDSQPVRKKTPERDVNFHKKLASFTSIENGEDEKVRERKTIPQGDPTLKNKIASYEQLEQLADSYTTIPREELIKNKDRSVSLERLDDPQVEVKMRPARSLINIPRRIPSTPYMVVDLGGSRLEEKCVMQTVPMVSDEPESAIVQDPAKRSTIYETVEKCQVIRDVDSAPMYSIFQYLSPEVNAQVFEIASKLEETPLLGSPVQNTPTVPLPVSPTNEDDSIEGAKPYTDDDINEVISDYEQVDASYEESPGHAENIYENITEEPMYENIYEKVDDENKDAVNEHHYQTLEEVREEVQFNTRQTELLPSHVPTTTIKPSAFDTPEVLDVTWTDGPSQAAPPSEPPPPPPPDDDSDIDASDHPQSLPAQEEDTFTRENSTRRLKKELWRRRSDFLGTSSQYIEEEATVKPPPDLSVLLRQEREAERSLLESQVPRIPTQEILSEAEIARREREIIENLERSEQLQQQQQQTQYMWEDHVQEDKGVNQDKNETDELLQYQECLNVDRNSCFQELPYSIPPPPPSPVSNITQPFAYMGTNMPNPSDFFPLSPRYGGDEVLNSIIHHGGGDVCSSPPPLSSALSECSVPCLTPIPECEEVNPSSPLFSLEEIIPTSRVVNSHPSSPKVLTTNASEPFPPTSPDLVDTVNSQSFTSPQLVQTPIVEVAACPSTSASPIYYNASCITKEYTHIKANSEKAALRSHSEVKGLSHFSETSSLASANQSQFPVTPCDSSHSQIQQRPKIQSVSSSLSQNYDMICAQQFSKDTSSCDNLSSVKSVVSKHQLTAQASQSADGVVASHQSFSSVPVSDPKSYSDVSALNPQIDAGVCTSILPPSVVVSLVGSPSLVSKHDYLSANQAPLQNPVSFDKALLSTASVKTVASDSSAQSPVLTSNSLCNLRNDLSLESSVKDSPNKHISSSCNTGTSANILLKKQKCKRNNSEPIKPKQVTFDIQDSAKKTNRGKNVRFLVDETHSNNVSELISDLSDSHAGMVNPQNTIKLEDSALNHNLHSSHSCITTSIFPSQAKNLQTSSESDTEPEVAMMVPVTSTNIPESSHSVSKTAEPEHIHMSNDAVDSSCSVLKSTINTEKRQAEILENHAVMAQTIWEVPSHQPQRTETQTSFETECQFPSESREQYPDHLVIQRGNLDYISDSVASSTSQPEEYKKLAELEEEMMQHDKDMLRRTGQLVDDPAAVSNSQPTHIPPPTPYASHEESSAYLHQLPSSAENSDYDLQQQPSPHLPIQEFYTAPTYESTSPSSTVAAEGIGCYKLQGQRNVALPSGSPSQYSTLASPHPFSRSNSQSAIETSKHPSLQAMRSTPLASPRESIPEPLPRKKKVPPPTPSKSQKLTGDLNTAERKEAIRLSRIAASESPATAAEQLELQGKPSSSGQQMSKQTLLALSAIPKPRLTDNESWITKKKPDAQKRDYSKHWLHQEAEQRRIEQKDRISRPRFSMSQPQPKTSQNISPQRTSPQHSSPQQTTSYLPTQSTFSYPPQSTAPTYSTYPQALRNSSPNHNANNNTNNNNNNNNNNNGNSNISSSNTSWRNQATTYQPQMPTPAPNGDKALPDSIIHNLTQRVNSKNNKNTYTNASGRLGNNYGSNNYRDENYHDYMNADALSAPHPHAPLYQSGLGPGQPSPPTTQQDITSSQDQRLLSVSGKKKCSHCSEELGRGAAMIIESLRLFYHIPCFKCCVCGIQLGNGSAGADVRVRNHKLHCHNCYSNDEGMKFSKV